MLANLKLGTKFTLLLIAVLLCGIVIVGVVAWQVALASAESEFASRGVMLLDLMDGVRAYTQGHITPLLTSQQKSQTDFISESVPNFSAHTVFQLVQKNKNATQFTYKEAAVNARNQEDSADAFENGLVQQMSANRKVVQLTGYRTENGKTYFFVAKPIIVQSAACLNCHGEASQAPMTLVAKYGPVHGFGWEMNQVVAAQMAYVPADQVLGETLQRLAILMFVFGSVFALAILLINIAIRRYVIAPVNVIGSLADKVAADAITPEDLQAATLARVSAQKDELGGLSRAFVGMARQVYERTQNLKQAVQQLHIEIDEIKRKKQVKDVVESDTFREIQAQARRLRERRAEQEKMASGPGPD